MLAVPSVSDHLTLEQVIARLASSPLVDGVAEFGSRVTKQAEASSDYDLLVLVRSIPARVFQLVTTIDGRLTDVVLVEIETADTLLTLTEPPAPRSFEALFAQKMRTAHIHYDASARLRRIQALVNSQAWQERPLGHPDDSDLYAAWFWLGFGLVQLERMAQSVDPTHLSAVDMMLTSCLSETWRSYFEIRRIPWEGEKGAIRYWTKHDPDYMRVVQQCLAIGDRNKRLAAYRELVERTTRPVGKPMAKGDTAAILSGANTSADVQKVLQYWQSLFDA